MERKKPINKGQDAKAGYAERKRQIRAELKSARGYLSQVQVQEYSQEICARIQSCSWFWQAEWIYFYYPLGKEVNLLPLARQALEHGMQIAFPRVEGSTMDFYPVSSLSDFSEGSFHVMEPMGRCAVHQPSPLVFVPGVAFDSQGTRMGYGKGYYDRYFSRYPFCRKIGISYSIQLTDNLPQDSYDIPMDALVTEQEINFFLPPNQNLSLLI